MTEEKQMTMDDFEVQTTVNEDPIEVLVEDGEVENVCN